MNNIFDFKGLLDNGSLERLLLNRDLDLNTSRMRFGPDETGVNDSDFVQAPELA